MLIVFVLSTLILGSSAISEQCDRSPSLKFSVSSWRNESGHRLVAADVRSEVSEVDRVSLTVELLSDKCGDSRAVILKTLSSTGQPEEQTSVRTTVEPTQSQEQASVSSTAAPTQPEENASVTSTVAPTAQVVPLPGYNHFPGYGYYKVLPNEMTWTQGVEACRKEGTRMLLVESQEEIETLYKWAGCCAWVGVHRESSSGPWMNILGQQMNSTDFFGWLPSYPSATSNCMILDSSGEMGTSNNAKCNTQWKVICEQVF
ncbi:C-type lectin domain family 4 member K-like [Anabrus simplex]|uniref:C-type lectin domain family 4 member K-like n=1 Tax=Anabrus simplex TaxID=316456 RepID=UPI0035A34AA5